MRTYLVLFLFLIGHLSIFYSQEYKIEYFGQNVGLNDPFIYSIEQDKNGFLLVGTGEGIGVFDGSEFKMYYTSDHLAENFVSCSYKDSKGNIWYGHKGGGASIYDGNNFDLVHPGDGVYSMVNGIAEDKDGLIWFAAQDFGLYNVDQEGNFSFYNDQFDRESIYSFCINKKGYFFIGTNERVDIYQYLIDEDGGIISKVQEVSGIPIDQVVDLLPMEDGSVLVATLASGIYKIKQKDGVFVANALQLVNYNRKMILRSISFDDGYYWITSLQAGLLKAELEDNKLVVQEIYNANNGLKSNSVNTSFIDREGMLWIGTYGDGLASRASNLFTFYLKNDTENNLISSIKVNETEVWVGSYGTINIYDKYSLKLKKVFAEENNLPKDVVSCMYFDKDSVFYIGTESKGLYMLDTINEMFYELPLSQDDLSKTITSVMSVDDKLWVGTLNGVYKLNPKTGGLVSYNVSTGLAHNSVGTIFATEANEIYIGTRSAFLSKYADATFENRQLTPDLNIVTANMILEDAAGGLWLSTSDHGVFYITDTVMNFTVEEGLESNYCYGVEQDKNGMVWVMHNGGLSKINIDDFSIEQYNSRHGVDTRFLRASVSKYKDQIWFGTENGAILYSSKNDKRNEVPPITIINELMINDVVYTDSVINLPYGEYDIQVMYKGISLKKADMVTYECMLEGYEAKWSDKTYNNEIKYLKVRDGEYSFRVRSYNSDGILSKEKSVVINIKRPIWKYWWFYFVLFIILLLVIVAIVKLRERSHLQYQKKLENQLALRTKEVVEQKEEIEEINKDLTDSINYAKRIQSAILPEEHYFKELFPLSFVYYKPRDIVSGDFYWCNKIGGKTYIVCADCTGHGVPGGFMSMIGMMLVFETCVLKGVSDPAEILADVDQHIKDILRQTDDFESNKDGMDMSVCVIDENSNLLQFAGAMRPLYIYRHGIMNIIKGDRYSLGGNIIKGKSFTTQEYRLTTGDKLYMFSDGFADQFGGPYKRKMKLTGLNELLDQVSQLPIEKQVEEIDNFFNNWKGDMPQMDDVILIGIEID